MAVNTEQQQQRQQQQQPAVSGDPACAPCETADPGTGSDAASSTRPGLESVSGEVVGVAVDPSAPPSKMVETVVLDAAADFKDSVRPGPAAAAGGGGYSGDAETDDTASIDAAAAESKPRWVLVGADKPRVSVQVVVPAVGGPADEVEVDATTTAAGGEDAAQFVVDDIKQLVLEMVGTVCAVGVSADGWVGAKERVEPEVAGVVDSAVSVVVVIEKKLEAALEGLPATDDPTMVGASAAAIATNAEERNELHEGGALSIDCTAGSTGSAPTAGFTRPPSIAASFPAGGSIGAMPSSAATTAVTAVTAAASVESVSVEAVLSTVGVTRDYSAAMPTIPAAPLNPEPPAGVVSMAASSTLIAVPMVCASISHVRYCPTSAELKAAVMTPSVCPSVTCSSASLLCPSRPSTWDSPLAGARAAEGVLDQPSAELFQQTCALVGTEGVAKVTAAATAVVPGTELEAKASDKPTVETAKKHDKPKTVGEGNSHDAKAKSKGGAIGPSAGGGVRRPKKPKTTSVGSAGTRLFEGVTELASEPGAAAEVLAGKATVGGGEIGLTLESRAPSVVEEGIGVKFELERGERKKAGEEELEGAPPGTPPVRVDGETPEKASGGKFSSSPRLPSAGEAPSPRKRGLQPPGTGVGGKEQAGGEGECMAQESRRNWLIEKTVEGKNIGLVSNRGAVRAGGRGEYVFCFVFAVHRFDIAKTAAKQSLGLVFPVLFL